MRCYLLCLGALQIEVVGIGEVLGSTPSLAADLHPNATAQQTPRYITASGFCERCTEQGSSASPAMSPRAAYSADRERTASGTVFEGSQRQVLGTGRGS